MDNRASIVIGVDFTPASRVALTHAMRIAAWLQSPLHAIHVIDTLVVADIAEALGRRSLAELETTLIADAKVEWAEFTRDVPGASTVPFDVKIENRLVGIVEEVARRRADLLVIGAFGTRQAKVGLGTVATACVRKSPADVLLVRDTHAGPFRRIVAAVDFSDTSLRAVGVAARLAAREGAHLHIMHVFQAPWHRLHYRSPTLEADPSFQTEYQHVLRRRLIEFTRNTVGPLSDTSVEWTIYHYDGHRSGIAAFAQEIRAELIVLGTRGRTNVRDLLFGSTAEKTLDETECSVLAVKPEGFSHPLTAA
jgi:nucleotide-binding universal stress UspA family protein